MVHSYKWMVVLQPGYISEPRLTDGPGVCGLFHFDEACVIGGLEHSKLKCSKKEVNHAGVVAEAANLEWNYIPATRGLSTLNGYPLSIKNNCIEKILLREVLDHAPVFMESEARELRAPAAHAISYNTR